MSQASFFKQHRIFNIWLERDSHGLGIPVKERKGTVVVAYTNGTRDPFPGILESDFFQWEDSGYDPRFQPEGVTIRKPDKPTFGGKDPNDIEDEQEPIPLSEENQEPAIAENDPLGQITGIPSPGHGLGDEILPEDHLGQATGIPSPGFEPDSIRAAANRLLKRLNWKSK